MYLRVMLIFLFAAPTVQSHLRTRHGTTPLRTGRGAANRWEQQNSTNQSVAGFQKVESREVRDIPDRSGRGGWSRKIEAFADDQEEDALLVHFQRRNSSQEGVLTPMMMAKMQTAVTKAAHTVFQCVRENVTSLSNICKAFGLDTEACGRAETYLGALAHSDEGVKVKVNHLDTALGQRCNFCQQVMKLTDIPCSSIDAGPDCFAESGGCRPNTAKQFGPDFCRFIEAAKRFPSFSDVLEKPVLFSFGDNWLPCKKPTLLRTRILEDAVGSEKSNSIILDLEHERHWEPLKNLSFSDIQFSEKVDKLVWRGVSTGVCDATRNNSRMMFITKYSGSSDPRIDVGISEVVQHCIAAEKYTKPKMPLADQLKAKYIMVVNGNDKASGLNWAMASNSVPFMTRPTVESWLRETSLIAGEHYVQIEPDFSDLVLKLDWAIANPSAAQRIAEAGQQYMRQFFNADTEANINGAVLAAYLTRVHVEVDPTEVDPTLTDRESPVC